MTKEYTPVVIIGAGRSGTNILRDMLTQLPDFATWPCDEINPIWRHGNISWPDDEIPPERATPNVRRFIRKAFDRIWRQQGQPKFVVEKTCANALRVPFVDQVLPDAVYVHLVRDGVDVLASARKRWQGDLELPGLPYFLAKARYAPLVDLPIYGASFLRRRIGLLMGHKKQLSIWGPRFAGMDKHKDLPLIELCALQWAACVQSADTAFENIDPARVVHLRYEDMVADPQGALTKIATALGIEIGGSELREATKSVRVTSVGKGRAAVKDELSASVMDVITPVLNHHGY